MNPKNVIAMLSELRCLKYFPDDEAVMVALARLVGKMATSEHQVRWLVDRMTSGLYREWPGIAEVRACFCSKFPPADGFSVASSVYLDGIPSEREAELRQFDAAPMRMLAEGAPKEFHTADPDIDSVIRQVAAAKAMPAARRESLGIRGRKFADELEHILTAPADRKPLPSPTPQVIGPAEMDVALAEYRAKKAQESGS